MSVLAWAGIGVAALVVLWVAYRLIILYAIYRYFGH